MRLTGRAKLLRVFVGERDMYHHRPLYEVIITRAKTAGLAGATVIRAIAGFGAASRVIHTAKIERLSEDLPILIELVDTEEHIREFIPFLEGLFEEVGCGGLMTIEDLEIMKYTHGE